MHLCTGGILHLKNSDLLVFSYLDIPANHHKAQMCLSIVIAMPPDTQLGKYKVSVRVNNVPIY